MRPGLSALLLALLPCLVPSPALAEDGQASLIQIDDQLFTKHDELSTARQTKDEQQALLDKKQAELNSLDQQAKAIEKAFTDAKQKLESDYQSMIDDPSVDLAASQQAYQDAWSTVKQNQKARLAAEQAVEEQRALLITRNAEVEAIEKIIVGLGESKIRARVEQLNHELQQPSNIAVSFTNRCQPSMTLAQCDQQTRDLALQKAVKQFRSELPNQTSESALVKRNIDDTALNIHVLRHTTKQSGFYDGVRYRIVMDVELETRPSETVACQLLQVENQYCFAPGVDSTKQLPVDQEIAWVTFSLRSNQYNDNVFIDGVSYGSTPIEVMLPTGSHNVLIKKEGYQPFNRQISIKSDTSLRAVLTEKANPLRDGTKFADGMANKGSAPEVVTLLPGKFFVGEQGSKQVYLDHAFAIGVTPVTVSQFATFVEHTSYQTDAELKNTCTALVNAEVTPIANSSWRDPGFKQYPNSPVVCISQNDASSYTNWLRQQTGASYRLPTEDEWEIAARAGSQDKYWWGDEFKPGQANTGWSGTPWSNISTAPVSAFKPNQLGVYDSVGNVWQWTSSPRGIVKGGAWNFSPNMAAADKQLFLSPSEATNYVGFRIVRDIN